MSRARSLLDRLQALASEALEIATEVEQLERAATAGSEATRTLAALRATLGIAASSSAAPPSPATSRPPRSPRVADSSDAGVPSVAAPKSPAPTHCESPDCGKPITQGGGASPALLRRPVSAARWPSATGRSVTGRAGRRGRVARGRRRGAGGVRAELGCCRADQGGAAASHPCRRRGEGLS